MYIEIDPKDEAFDIKKHIAKKESTHCLCHGTLEHFDALKFLSWIRFVVFVEEEDIPADSNMDLSKLVTDTHLKPISVVNELKCWKLVSEKTFSNLNDYKTTYEEDLEILKKDETEKTLTNAERNIVLLKKGEKEVLTFLK